VACVRASDGDGRTRHRGVSHHTTTALGLTGAVVAVPVPEVLAADPALSATGHDVVAVEVPDVGALLEARGLHVTTMGRGPAEDPLFFAAAGAAGVHVAGLLGA
jgi:hypothetical protein